MDLFAIPVSNVSEISDIVKDDDSIPVKKLEMTI